MTESLNVLPLDTVGAVALACVFLAMTAAGIGVEPARVLARGFPARAVVAALLVALVAVPITAILLAEVLGLQSGPLVGLLLMGISPGAPLALRKSHQSGGDAEFAVVLQVAVAVLAIGAVPLWIAILQAVYGREAGLSVAVLAKQVFLAQVLPLSCGIALRHLAPARARQLVRPMLIASGVLMATVGALILFVLWRPLAGLPPAAFVASASLTIVALVLAYAACGPSPSRRMSAGTICALRNPGVALLIASANGLPAGAKVMVIAHVLVTAIILAVYLGLLKRGEDYRREATPTAP
ncbi:hypothetical protein [Alsobacter sp. R-9]